MARLEADGFVTTEKDDRGYTTYVPASPGTPVHAVDGQIRDKPGTSVQGRAPGKTACADPGKDREAPHTANRSDPVPLIEARCRCCRIPQIRQQVNRQLAEGWSLGAILQGLAGANAELPPSRRVSKDSLETHRRKHFPIQSAAGSVWRSILEDRLERESATYDEGVLSLVTPAAFMQVMVAKAFAGLASDGAEIGPDLGLRAAAELHKLTAADSGTDQMAKIMATQNRIVAAFRTLPERYQARILNELEPSSAPPVGGAPRLAVIEGGVATDQEFDPLDDDDEDGENDFGEDED